MEVIPLLGPETGIVDILAWIQGASSTLEIMMYQIQHPLIVEALIDAEERGVEVSIILDAGESWWKNYDLETQKGMAAELVDNGAEYFGLVVTLMTLMHIFTPRLRLEIQAAFGFLQEIEIFIIA